MLKTTSNFSKFYFIFSIISLRIFPLLFFTPVFLSIKQNNLNQIVFMVTPIVLILNIAINVYSIIKKKSVMQARIFLIIAVLELIIIGSFLASGIIAAASFVEGVGKVLN